MSVFISYSRENSTDAKHLRRWLLKHGFKESDIFLDTQTHQGTVVGQQWESTLRKAISSSHYFVIVLTRDWQSSDICKWEYDMAVSSGSTVIPILVEDIPFPEINEELTKLQICDISTFENETVGYSKLSYAITPSGAKRSVFWATIAVAFFGITTSVFFFFNWKAKHTDTTNDNTPISTGDDLDTPTCTDENIKTIEQTKYYAMNPVAMENCYRSYLCSNETGMHAERANINWCKNTLMSHHYDINKIMSTLETKQETIKILAGESYTPANAMFTKRDRSTYKVNEKEILNCAAPKNLWRKDCPE